MFLPKLLPIEIESFLPEDITIIIFCYKKEWQNTIKFLYPVTYIDVHLYILRTLKIKLKTSIKVVYKCTDCHTRLPICSSCSDSNLPHQKDIQDYSSQGRNRHHRSNQNERNRIEEKLFPEKWKQFKPK
jgi:hypothetical protein